MPLFDIVCIGCLGRLWKGVDSGASFCSKVVRTDSTSGLLGFKECGEPTTS